MEPVFQPEAFNLGEMFLIVSHKCCIDHQGMGSNHCISETDGFALFEQC